MNRIILNTAFDMTNPFIGAIVDVGTRFAHRNPADTYIEGTKPLADHAAQEQLEPLIRMALDAMNLSQQVDEFNERWIATTVTKGNEELIYIALIRDDDPEQEQVVDEQEAQEQDGSPSHA